MYRANRHDLKSIQTLLLCAQRAETKEKNKDENVHRYAVRGEKVKLLDRAERHDLKSRLWLLFSPFLFPPKRRGKKKRRMNSKNRVKSFCMIKLLEREKPSLLRYFISKKAYVMIFIVASPLSEYKPKYRDTADIKYPWFNSIMIIILDLYLSIWFVSKKTLNTYLGWKFFWCGGNLLTLNIYCVFYKTKFSDYLDS